MPDQDPTARLLRGVDSPRPLPPDVRDQIVHHITGSSPRPLPAGLHARLEASLLTAGARRRWYAEPRALLVAASIAGLALLATAVLVSPAGPDQLATSPGRAEVGPSVGLGAPPAPAPAISSLGSPSASASVPGVSTQESMGTPAPAGTAAAGGPAPAPRPAAPPASSPAAGSPASGSSSTRRGAPPPYSEGGQPDRTGAPAPAAGCCTSSSPPASSEQSRPVVIGITAGDPRIEAGFRAYVEAVNGAGGVGGRPVRLVAAVGQRPAEDSSVTVNLGAEHLPGWSGGPLLETLTVPEARLTGDTFSVASVVEHQARLAVDEVFPDSVSGRTAVIYTSTGAPWVNRVPDAYESVLRSRAVAVTRVMYDAGSPAFAPADAAFLSLDPEATSRWLRDAKAAGYAPSQGVTGIYPLHDAQLASTAPAPTRVLSPYRFPVGDEAAALQSAVGHLDARAVHGWATAKHLAVALWRSGAHTARQTADALRAMDGYDGRIAPPYDTRPGTTSRRPDALLHRLDGGDFVASGDFRTDPR